MAEALTHLIARAQNNPHDLVATDAEGRTSSALTMAGRVAATAAAMGRQESPVGVLADDGPDWIVAALAARALGATLVPLPAFFSDQQLDHVVRDSGIATILASPCHADRARGLAGSTLILTGELADPAGLSDRGGNLIVYTSGTTGQPKGLILSAQPLDLKAAALGDACAARQDDCHLSVLPVSLLLELICAVHVVLMNEGRVVFAPALPGDDARTAGAMLLAASHSARPSVTVLVPSLLALWVGALEATGQRAPDSLRLVAVGGAHVPAGLAERGWALGLPVHEGYGMTECCSVVALNRPGSRRSLTVGKPLAGVDIRIEAGEIIVDDLSVMTGYLHGEVTLRPWRTGDLGRLLNDGSLEVLGRRDDIIVTAQGRNLSPAWPEAVVLEERQIDHCAVFAGGERPRAVLEGKQPAGGDLTTLALARWRTLPDYATPDEIIVVAPGTFRSSGWLRPDGSLDRRAIFEDLGNPAEPETSPVSVEAR